MFSFKSIDTSKSIFNEEQTLNTTENNGLKPLTDAGYIQEMKLKIKELDEKIKHYEVWDSHNKNIMKMKLLKKTIEKQIFNKTNKIKFFD